MAKKKSDEDFITEAVLAATKRRISKMSGAELKASADKMAAQEKQFSSKYAPGDQIYDWNIGDWEDTRKSHEYLNPHYPDLFELMAPAPPKEREQDYGPWQKGRPLAVRWGTGGQWGTPGPYPYEGTTELWGQSHSDPIPMARPEEGPGSDRATVDPEDVRRYVMRDWPPEESVVLPSGKLNNEQIKRDIEGYRRMKEAYPNDNEMERFLEGRSPAPREWPGSHPSEQPARPNDNESEAAKILKEAYRQETGGGEKKRKQ